MTAARTIVHIGYPKAGSTFLQEYMDSHPELDSSLEALDALDGNSSAPSARASASASGTGRVRLITNEKIAESLITADDGSVWSRNKFLPGTWADTARVNRVDPAETARRVRRGYGADRILIVIREQSAWLQSAYKYYLPNLPAGRRSFAEFCDTSVGQVYLEIGHYDRVIAAYLREFGGDNVRVLRAEMLRHQPESFAAAFCDFAGVAYRPIPQGSANVGPTNEAAVLRAWFPVVDRLPSWARRMGSAVLSHVASGRASVVSENEIAGIRERYAESNRRTEQLLKDTQHTGLQIGMTP